MSVLPPLTWLQAFESAARTLSFTAAGQELGVTQAAISQRVRLLEDRLGQRLFVRHPRSLSLTPAGQSWLPSLQDGFTRLTEGTREVFGEAGDAPITLRTTPVMQQNWLAPRLPAFRQQHPEVALRLVSAIWPDDFGPEGADLEIRYGQGTWPGMETISLGREEMLPVCAPALAERITGPEDLAGHTLLHAVGFAVGWPTWLDAVGMPALASRCMPLICDTQTMTLTLAAMGEGIALTHRRLVEYRRDLAVALELPVNTDEGFWVARPTRHQPRPEAAIFWDWLAEHLGPTGVDQ
ncbi:MAG: LysR substrate-binding domain-containing protein [Halomonas sp.]|nr:LysR substrate-binding domain-containing protein [Halomonas sp.]MDN6297028.1 LysR substrate-binding domain-containing protein [Halomonas sp.]MDN6313736.1 LysR substrate-binding domain-containing protein [Halomonas sp.]MDN6335715.1 LysR substrate-binding domain-containing protein [Halomonas sp.]